MRSLRQGGECLLYKGWWSFKELRGLRRIGTGSGVSAIPVAAVVKGYGADCPLFRTDAGKSQIMDRFDASYIP